MKNSKVVIKTISIVTISKQLSNIHTFQSNLNTIIAVKHVLMSVNLNTIIAVKHVRTYVSKTPITFMTSNIS